MRRRRMPRGTRRASVGRSEGKALCAAVRAPTRSGGVSMLCMRRTVGYADHNEVVPVPLMPFHPSAPVA